MTNRTHYVGPQPSDRLSLLALSYALISLAGTSNAVRIRENVERVAFLPKHRPHAKSVLSEAQYEIFLECSHVDDFRTFPKQSFLNYIADLQARLIVEIESETIRSYERVMSDHS